MAINHRVAINHCASAPACQRRGQWRLQGFVGGGEGMGGGGSALAESFALTFQLHSGESSGFSSGMGGNGSCPRGNLDPIPPPPLALGESLTSLAAARPLLGTAPPSSWSVSSASVPLQRDGMFLPPPPQPPHGLFPPSQPPQSSSEAHTQWVVSVLSTGSIHSRQHGDSGFIHVGTESGGRNGWAWAGGLGGGEREGGGIGLVPCSLLVGVFHPCCGKRRSGLVLLSSSPSPRLSSCYPLWGGRSQPHLLPIHGGGSPVPTPSPEVPHHGRVLLHHVLHHLLDVLHTDFIWQDDSSGVQAGSAQSGQCPWGMDSP